VNREEEMNVEEGQSFLKDIESMMSQFFITVVGQFLHNITLLQFR